MKKEDAYQHTHTYRAPNRVDQKRKSSRNIVIITLTYRTKKNIKSSREKNQVTILLD